MNKDDIIKRLEEIIELLKNDDTTEEEAKELEEEARGLQEKLKGINAHARRSAIADKINGDLVDSRTILDDDTQKAKYEEEMEQRKKDLIHNRSITVSSSDILVPHYQGTEINDKEGEVSTLVDSVSTIKLPGGESYQESYVKSYKEGGVTEEGSDYSDGEPSYGYADMNKIKITAYAEISEEVEKLPAADYVANVENACKIAIKKKMNSQMLKGTGTKSFYGIFESPDAIDSSKDITISEINETTLDEIVFSYGGDEDTSEEATLILNKKDLKAFAKVRSKDGKKVYDIDKKAHTIDKVPYIINSNCHPISKTDDTTGTYYGMAYGKLTNYKIPVFSELEIKRSDDYKFKSGQVAFKANVMAAGNVVAQDGFIRVKKVVAASGVENDES